jgi:EAL domain-containing protein (putative c-di-GMP-specific phosphodiesterase class I)
MSTVTVSECIKQPDGMYTATYKNLTLTSAFQPIFSISHRRPVGYEGLLRATDINGQAHSPLDVLKLPQSSFAHLALDRTCRKLHIRNFARQQTGNSWLFLNLDSQCLVTERPDTGFMNGLFELTGIPPRRVVIEILESEIDDRDYLKQLIAHFRNLGCLIAIDDFGAGHSNFDRIWELEPDIVKIDRSLIRRAGVSSKIERILSGIVSLIHEAGSLALIEGVETKKEALIAIAVNADMVQGYYFANPDPIIYNNQDFTRDIDSLLHTQQRLRKQNTNELHQHFIKFEARYKQAIDLFMTTSKFESCADILFQEERAVRCYLLDEEGYQLARSLYSPRYREQLDERFTPLLAGDYANWSHKHYHYRAINRPGKIQVSRPYLSVAGSHMCITVSQAIVLYDKLYVFCCDLEWQDEEGV